MADTAEIPSAVPPGREPASAAPPRREPLSAEPPSAEPPGRQPLSAEPPGAEPASAEDAGRPQLNAQDPGSEPLAPEPLGSDPLGTEPPGQEPPGQEPPGQEPFAEAEPAVGSPPRPPPPARPPIARRRYGRLRWTAAIVFLLVAALLVPLTIAARYARGQLLDTERYVATVAPLAEDPAIRAALADRITNEIINRIDLPGLINQAVDAIPFNGPIATKGAAALDSLVSGPVTDWLRSFVHSHIEAFLHSAAFVRLWTQINRRAHQAVNKLLTGEQGGAVSTSGDSVVLNIGPVVDAAKTALVDQGFGLAAKVPTVNASFTLFESDQITKIQGYVRFFDRLANWLPWITLLCFVLALLIAPRRRRAAVVGLLMALAVLIALLAGNGYIRRKYLDQLAAKGLSQDAGLAVYNQIIHYLLVGIVTTLVAAAVTVVWLWLAGPGRVGTALRRAVAPGFGWAAAMLGWSRTGFWGAVHAYRAWVFLVLGVIAFIVLLQSPYISTVVWLTVAALVVAVAFAVLARLRRPVPVAT